MRTTDTPGMILNQESAIANTEISRGRGDVIRMSKNPLMRDNG